MVHQRHRLHSILWMLVLVELLWLLHLTMRGGLTWIHSWLLMLWKSIILLRLISIWYLLFGSISVLFICLNFDFLTLLVLLLLLLTVELLVIFLKLTRQRQNWLVE